MIQAELTRRPNAELEDMVARMFAPRAEITTEPNDPARLTAIAREWRVVISLMEHGYWHIFK